MMTVAKQQRMPVTKAKDISETTTSADAQDVLERLFAPEQFKDTPQPSAQLQGLPLRRRSLPQSFWSFTGQVPATTHKVPTHKVYTITKGRLCPTPTTDCKQMPPVPEKSIWKPHITQVHSSPTKSKQPIIKPKLPRAPKKTGTEKIIKNSISKRTALGGKIKKKSFKTKQTHSKTYTKVTPRGRSVSLDARRVMTKMDVRGQSPVSSEGSMRSISPTAHSLGMYELGLHPPFVTPTPDHDKNNTNTIQPLQPLQVNFNPQRSHSCPLPTMGYNFSENMLMDMDLDFNRDCTRSVHTGFLGGNEALDLLLEMTDDLPTDMLGLHDTTTTTDTNTHITHNATNTHNTNGHIDIHDIIEEEDALDDALGQFSNQHAKFLVCPTPLKKEC